MSTSTVPFKIKIENTDPTKSLNFEILLDNVRIFYSAHVNLPAEFSYEINDEIETDHVLEFVMTSKTSDHTKVDDQGNIVSDAMISVKSIEFDEIDIFKTFIENSEYTHDFNGSQSQITEKFYGDMGCNGCVSFKFTTPFYLWLLENM